MEWLTVLGYIVGGTGSAAGLSAYFGKKRGDEIIKYQAKDNATLKDYNSTLEASNARLEVESANWKQQAETFRSHAQGIPELIKLTRNVAELIKVVSDQTKAITAMEVKRNEESK